MFTPSVLVLKHHTLVYHVNIRSTAIIVSLQLMPFAISEMLGQVQKHEA